MHDLAAAEGIEILGIDPAPSKETTLWTRGRCHRLKPGEVRPEIEKRLSEGQALLIGWDAPLSFDPALVRRFIRGEAILAGDPKKGGYLLPRCAESASIAARVEEESSPAKPLLGLLPQDEPEPSRGLGT